jgi:hypothetical protein
MMCLVPKHRQAGDCCAVTPTEFDFDVDERVGGGGEFQQFDRRAIAGPFQTFFFRVSSRFAIRVAS